MVLATPTLSVPSTFYPAKDLIASVARFLAGTGNVEFSKSGPLRNSPILQQKLPVFKGVDWFQHGPHAFIPPLKGVGFRLIFCKSRKLGMSGLWFFTLPDHQWPPDAQSITAAREAQEESEGCPTDSDTF